MTTALRHRGPDAAGYWVDREGGVALGHRRLSIIDLSEAGSQPMVSASGRYVIAYNGEIYNHLELRSQLGAGPAWRGHSDTETLLAAIERWGIAEALGRCVGMFAFALWDREARTITLARDRMGEKPLYYGWNNGLFLFASELKAFASIPEIDLDLDPDAASLFFLHAAVPEPWSIYRGIFKLRPGHMLTLPVSADRAGHEPASTPYWSLRDFAGRNPFKGSAEEAVTELERLLSTAVAGQTISDVPIGAFLSGGIDSSAVVALMQQASSAPVHTFSIGFEEEGYNEAPFAAAVAAHIGTRHTELIVTTREAMEIIPSLPSTWDEPFADSSQIPTFLVSRLARSAVTVALSGDGGDELFCGYSRYKFARMIESIPAKGALLAGLSLVSPKMAAGLLRHAPHPLAKRLRADHMVRLRELLSARSPADRYVEFFYLPRWNAQLLQRGLGAYPVLSEPVPRDLSFLDMVSFTDATNYLPADILVKVDRAAMAVSLETRAPLLDHRIAEFAFSLPPEMKVRDGVTKWPLRSLLHRHVPKALVERPKMGFGLPIAQWLRTGLRDWAEALIATEDDLLDQARVQRLWSEHLAGDRNWEFALWRVLMFRAWLQKRAELAGTLSTSSLTEPRLKAAAR